MINRLSHRERARRGALLMLIGALHLLAILWLASQSVLRAPQHEMVTNLLNIASTRETPTFVAVAPTERVEPVVPSVSPIIVARSPASLTRDAPAMSADAMTDGSGTADGGCALAQEVGDAILANGGAMAELEGLPSQARTQADAVMLWDGAWPDYVPFNATSSNGVSLAGALRAAVERTIAAASIECRDALVAGPRFIALPGALRTTTIVVGSGQWQWAQLLDSGGDDRPSKHPLPVQTQAFQGPAKSVTGPQKTN